MKSSSDRPDWYSRLARRAGDDRREAASRKDSYTA